jgi:hypothetical protein
MPIRDIIAAALSRPAGRVVDGPGRDIVNEILADHGYASPAELAALKVDADSMRGRLSGVDARIAELESAAAALQDSVAALREELSRRPAESPAVRPSLAPAVAAPPAEPLEERQAWAERSVEQGSCKVLGCSERTHRSGFCVSHAGDWRAGRLAGFISPEGLVSVAGEPMLVDPSLAGRAYAVDGRVVQIDGRRVPTVGY